MVKIVKIIVITIGELWRIMRRFFAEKRGCC